MVFSAQVFLLPWLRFILRYFVLFDAIVNEVVFLISLLTFVISV